MFTLEELFSEENQKEAIRYFLEKPEGRGLDGIPVSEIEECWRLNGTQIMSEIREATEVYNEVCRKVSEEYSLEINSGKSGVYDALTRRILGYEFYRRKGGIEIRKHKYKPMETHGNWHTSVVRKVNKEYHIIQDGILNKQDYSLLFENEEKKHHIPVEAVEQLNLYGEVTLSTGVFKTLASKNIRCAVYNKYGTLEGY